VPSTSLSTINIVPSRYAKAPALITQETRGKIQRLCLLRTCAKPQNSMKPYPMIQKDQAPWDRCPASMMILQAYRRRDVDDAELTWQNMVLGSLVNADRSDSILQNGWNTHNSQVVKSSFSSYTGNTTIQAATVLDSNMDQHGVNMV
jgi:hypothetical protein